MTRNQKPSFLNSLFGKKETNDWTFFFEEGEKYRKQKNPRKALEQFQLALNTVRKINNRLAEGYIYRSLMGVCFDIGNTTNDIKYIDKALDYGEEAVLIAEEVGDKTLEGMVLGLLGRIYTRRMNMHSISSIVGTKGNPMLHIDGTEYQKHVRDLTMAIACHEKSVNIFREIGNAASTANALYLMAISFDETQDSQSALEKAREAFSIWTDLGHPMADNAEKYIAQLQKRRKP